MNAQPPEAHDQSSNQRICLDSVSVDPRGDGKRSRKEGSKNVDPLFRDADIKKCAA